jgi:hypothetical protein
VRTTIIKEERYILYVDAEQFILRVQELVSGYEPWPQNFRVQIPASSEMAATTAYASTAKEAVERAAEVLRNSAGTSALLESRGTGVG